MSALQAAQAATAQELRRRILLKQRETARRHQQTISLIKQRALELSTQRPENSAAINENDSASKQKVINQVIRQAEKTFTFILTSFR